MNKVILMGRLTRDPETRYTQGDNSMCIARYTLAVDRRFSRKNSGGENGGENADFIPCVVFGKSGEFAEKYFHKGIKICVTGRIQTGSYTNKDGVKVYTTEVVVEDQEFAESKNASGSGGNSGGSYGRGNQDSYGGNQGGYRDSRGGGQGGYSGSSKADDALDGFMNIPDGIDEELPFA